MTCLSGQTASARRCASAAQECGSPAAIPRSTGKEVQALICHQSTCLLHRLLGCQQGQSIFHCEAVR